MQSIISRFHYQLANSGSVYCWNPVNVIFTTQLKLKNLTFLYIVPEEMQLVDISYILKPSISTIHVLCRAHLGPPYLKITCPALDNEPGFQNINFDISKGNGKCKLTDNISHSYGCSGIIREIPWKQIENVTNFTCFCRMKRQVVVKNVKHKDSVKIINQGT